MKNTYAKMMNRLSSPYVLLAGAALLVTACATAVGTGPQAEAPRIQRSGSELWAQNCRRCHNFRSPSEYTDGEWDVVMFHMRVRANLTANEHELIRTFLKASN